MEMQPLSTSGGGSGNLARSLTALQGAAYMELPEAENAATAPPQSPDQGRHLTFEVVSLERPAAAAAAQPPAQPPPPAPDVGSCLRLAVWLSVLLAGFGLQRGLCAAGLPSDCDSMGAAELHAALSSLLVGGAGLAWMSGLTGRERFAWLFLSWRRAWLWALYLGIIPIYSALSNLPVFQESLASTDRWQPGMIALVAAVGALTLAAIAFHLRLALQAGGSGGGDEGSAAPAAAAAAADGGSQAAKDGEAPGSPSDSWRIGVPDAGDDGSSSSSSSSSSAAAGSAPGPADGGAAKLPRKRSSLGSSCSSSSGGIQQRQQQGQQQQQGTQRRRRRWRALGGYLLPRLAVLAYCATWLAALAASGAARLHLHHYALGWAAASFAAFNHPVSGVLLAAGAAVFVQGGASYGFDPLLAPAARGGCLPLQGGPQMTCSFWSAAPISLKVCNDAAPSIPWHDCTVAWPWPETDWSRRSGAAGAGGGSSGTRAPAAAAASPPAGSQAPP